MDKLLWVLLPIALACAAVGWLAWRARLPPRPVLNVAFSLLLLVYLLVTAGLGIFWVANQHLPVFDWHYVFGYALLLLVVVHLGFNLRAVVFHLRRRPVAAVAPAARGRRPLLGAFGLFGLAAAAGGGYAIGLRHGRTELRIDTAAVPGAGAAAPGALALAVVERFHGFSAHTRTGLLRRAPGVDWGDPPPPFKPAPPGRGPGLVLPAPRQAQAGAGGLDAAALADLLWHTAGISARSGGIHFRTAPSSGALFATELYLWVRDIPGVPPGLWHYDVPAHALQPVAAGAAFGAGLPGIGSLPPDTRALVLATAVFRRSGHKYRDRTYRYVLGDLGHALENLRVVALQAGGTVTLLQAFDESRIAAALGIDEREEGVLAAVLLQGADAAALPALAGAAWRPPVLAGPDESEGTSLGASAGLAQGATLGITEAIHRATSLRAAVLPACGHTPPVRPVAALAGPDAWPAPLQPAAPGVSALPADWQQLPAAGAGLRDPLALIAQRRSVRRYGPQPLPLADLAGVLAAMEQPGPLLSAAVVIDVLALRVQGLAPGGWRYHPQLQALQPRALQAEGLSRRARAAGLDQDVIGDAAAVFVLAMDRATFAADPAGAARGYRHAFIEAGLVGERVYLEAGARGLGVCAVGAFHDDEAAALVGADPAREWVLHFAAVGVRA
jgi:SagB-type dehydrogenase family enzyme